MSTSLNFPVVLLFAVLLSCARLLWHFSQTINAERPHAWRIMALIILQIACAALLFFSLFPPERQTRAERLVIVSAHAQSSAIKTSQGRVLALPEAPVFAGMERVADLASALRKHPGVDSIEVIGDGLPLRDVDAARHLSVHQSPGKLPDGIVALSWTERVSPGMRWWVSGRVNGTEPRIVELLDPANVIVDRAQTDKDGRFKLSDSSRSAGQANYHIRAVTAQKKIAENLVVPLFVENSKPIRILSLAGGPNPELKYLRRWASDAGAVLESRVELGQGMRIQTANSDISAAGLRDLDLLILDERAWNAMSPSSKQLLVEALNNGLGVLLRLTGPLTVAAANDLRRLGFSVSDSTITQGVRIAEPQGKQLLPELNRRPVRVQSRDGMPLLQTDKSEPLAIWRSQGQGRIALWWLTDSYKLALSNALEQHGQLWSEAAATLARARVQPVLQSRQQHLWINQRAVFCGLAENARVQESDGQSSPLIADLQGANKGCAAFWPRRAGWHVLNSRSERLPFYVRASTEAPGLQASAMREANNQLSSRQIPPNKQAMVSVPGNHWPYFIFWLLLTALLWILERSKLGFKKTVA